MIDCLSNRLDLVGGVIGNVDVELFFEFHDKFYGVQRIGTEVVDEMRIAGDFFFFNTELFGDNIDDSLLNR